MLAPISVVSQLCRIVTYSSARYYLLLRRMGIRPRARTHNVIDICMLMGRIQNARDEYSTGDLYKLIHFNMLMGAFEKETGTWKKLPPPYKTRRGDLDATICGAPRHVWRLFPRTPLHIKHNGVDLLIWRLMIREWRVIGGSSYVDNPVNCWPEGTAGRWHGHEGTEGTSDTCPKNASHVVVVVATSNPMEVV